MATKKEIALAGIASLCIHGVALVGLEASISGNNVVEQAKLYSGYAIDRYDNMSGYLKDSYERLKEHLDAKKYLP